MHPGTPKQEETPPRAWGKPSVESVFAGRVGNTPTCVGKTICRVCIRRSGGKHPHVRGENTAICRCSRFALETPPRAWGKLNRCIPKLRLDRNTPTCVGKTADSLVTYPISDEHPHVRGENRPKTSLASEAPETPPRAWGKRMQVEWATIETRNTPTCVGKTLAGLSSRHMPRKHPHVRGENRLITAARAHLSETPPRAWGKPLEGVRDHKYRRNTPTCVGKTLAARLSVRQGKKHPHVRGENAGRVRTGVFA